MSSLVSSTTLKSWRERSPFSFSLKIQNFSQIEQSTLFSDGKYQSGLFSSGGYNWRMILYSKGNDKDNGSGFLSMYVEIDRTSLLLTTPPSEVFADIRFFVFNKTENKYYTIQYVDSKLFNTFRTVWGFAQVLPLDIFNHPKTGYIFGGDQCEFGVDVIVAPPPTNWEIHSLHEKLSQPKFSWTIKNFSGLKDNFYSSSTFLMRARKWVLKLYPKGDPSAEGKWLSLYLHLAQSETLKEGEKVFVQAHLRVLDPRGSKHVTHTIAAWHISSNLGWGYRKFVSLEEVPKAYLDKDTLNVEIEFEVVSEAEYSPLMIS